MSRHGGMSISIPDFQSIMRPLLEVAANRKEHSLSEVTEELAQRFKLTAEERVALLPSPQWSAGDLSQSDRAGEVLSDSSWRI